MIIAVIIFVCCDFARVDDRSTVDDLPHKLNCDHVKARDHIHALHSTHSTMPCFQSFKDTAHLLDLLLVPHLTIPLPTCIRAKTAQPDHSYGHLQQLPRSDQPCEAKYAKRQKRVGHWVNVRVSCRRCDESFSEVVRAYESVYELYCESAVKDQTRSFWPISSFKEIRARNARQRLT